MSCYTTAEFENGNQVKLTATFKDKDTGDVVDPDTVNLKVTKPDGTSNTYVYNTDVEIVKSSTGVYYSNVSLDQLGVWYYEWWSTGTGQSRQKAYLESID